MKRIIIKLGGSALDHKSTLEELALLVQGLHRKKAQVMIIHGGGPAINQELTARGLTWQFIDGQRQTTPEMIDIIEEVLAGKVNHHIVNTLRFHHIKAIGFSGAQDQILKCQAASELLMLVGRIEEVQTETIESLLERDWTSTPVIAPIGFGSTGEKYNINADWAAAQIAISLSADQLIFLTDQDGIWDKNKIPMTETTVTQLEELIFSGVIAGGMATKAKAMIAAIENGVQSVQVLKASAGSQLLKEQQIGTTLLSTALNLNQGGLHGRTPRFEK